MALSAAFCCLSNLAKDIYIDSSMVIGLRDYEFF